MELTKRWQSLMSAFGFSAHSETYETLTSCYQEPHRHYHTLTHLRSCFSYLDAYAESGLCQLDKLALSEIELALWFHDAIYQPKSTTNEVDSAAELASFLSATACQQAQVSRLLDLVLVTQHPSIANNIQQAILLDIDLSILGADDSRYDHFEQAIRLEYN